jgi:hypothetical protein
MDPIYKKVQDIQSEYFQILDDFFCYATGVDYKKFGNIEQFSEIVRKRAKDLGSKGRYAYPWFEKNIREFYSKNKLELFNLSKKIGGFKLVSGGSGRFLETDIEAVRRLLLYSDTILIPDPVLPWFEKKRSEERFQHVLLLKSVFTTLHLKPLINANLTSPAIVFFPSYDKSLEENDSTTQEYINNLIVGLVSYHCNIEINNIDELQKYAQEKSNDFLKKIEASNLFLPPGGSIRDSIQESLTKYREYIKTWRSDEYVKFAEKGNPALLALLGIFERVGPQYHLIENSTELSAHPLISLNQQWHYFQLCSNFFSHNLQTLNLVKPETISLINALRHNRFNWLSNAPFKAIAELRQNNENVTFRKKLAEHIKELHECDLGDIDKVSNEIATGISSLLSEHSTKVKNIADKYARKYTQTAVAAWISLGATIIPALAPWVTMTAPFALISKYAWDKVSEKIERKELSRSLVGVLSSSSRGKD